jgi:hypothetical protein
MQVDAANPARFEAMAGSAAPGPHSLHVRNLGAGSLTYAITENIPWLDVTGPNPGSVSATALETVTLTVNSAFAALVPGVYTAPLTVTSAALGSPQIVNVELLIYPRPRLALSTNTLPFNAFVESGNPAWQYLYVRNAGAGILDWTATPDGAWVRTQGALNGRAPNAFQVGADIAALDLGLHHGNVAVSSDSPGVEGSPQIADVVLHVDTARRMALSAVRLDDFAYVQGQPPPAQTFRIYNAGSGGAFDWQAESDAPWLILGATAGTADESGTTVQASVNPALLSVGAHRATITVRGDRVKGAVQTIRVLAFVASPSAPSCLPGVHLDLVKTSLLQIAVDIASVDAYHGAACDITADVELTLPGLKRTFRAPGSISAANALLVPLPGTLRLALAGVGLNLSSVQVANDGLTAQGQWDFGGVLGQTRSAGAVRIGKNGFTFDGATTFPINQTWNFQGFSFRATQGRLRTAQSFDDFVIEVDGELTIRILGSRDVKVNLTLAVSRNGVQATGGVGEIPLPNFSFSLVGFTVQTREARFANGRVRIGRGEIRTPANWGGQGADIYDITIDGNGRVSVGGGKFRLPALKAGGLNLMSLEGALRESTRGYLANGALQPAAGYEIQARGEFGVPGMGGGGACAIMVDITVYVDVIGALVLKIAPVEALAASGPGAGGPHASASPAYNVMSLAPAACVDEKRRCRRRRSARHRAAHGCAGRARQFAPAPGHAGDALSARRAARQYRLLHHRRAGQHHAARPYRIGQPQDVDRARRAPRQCVAVEHRSAVDAVFLTVRH